MSRGKRAAFLGIVLRCAAALRAGRAVTLRLGGVRVRPSTDPGAPLAVVRSRFGFRLVPARDALPPAPDLRDPGVGRLAFYCHPVEESHGPVEDLPPAAHVEGPGD